MTLETSLLELTAQVIDRKTLLQARISPAWVATEVMQVIDPDRSGPSLEYTGCHLYVRQLARQLLRDTYEPDDPAQAKQHELWPHLQTRYPGANSTKDEIEYVLLEHLTDADIAYNVARLRREGRAKLQHADALEAYGRERKAA